jgi:hypothetical protein
MRMVVVMVLLLLLLLLVLGFLVFARTTLAA